MYIPNLTLNSTNPKITTCFEWIHNNIALVTLVAVFISGVIFVNLPDKKRNNISHIVETSDIHSIKKPADYNTSKGDMAK